MFEATIEISVPRHNLTCQSIELGMKEHRWDQNLKTSSWDEMDKSVWLMRFAKCNSLTTRFHELLIMSNTSRLDSCPILSRMFPLNFLSLRCNSLRDDISPKVIGIGPEIEFCDRLRYFRSLKLPNWFDRWPLKLLAVKWQILKSLCAGSKVPWVILQTCNL